MVSFSLFFFLNFIHLRFIYFLLNHFYCFSITVVLIFPLCPPLPIPPSPTPTFNSHTVHVCGAFLHVLCLLPSPSFHHCPPTPSPLVTVIPLVGIHPKNPKSSIQKNLCTPRLILALFTIAKCWKQLKCPSVNEWIKKMVHLHNGTLCSRKKKGAPTFCNSMDGTESIVLSEIRQSVKDKYHTISPIKKNLMNKIN